MHKSGKLYILSAPSGTGKSTVISALLKCRTNLFFSVSATTRQPRAGERDGVQYHFVSKEAFLAMIEAGELLEHAEYVGNFYGTPLKPIQRHLADGDDVLLDIEVQGHRQIIQKMPEAVSIFLVPPSMEELERRLRNRHTDNEEVIARRLKKASEELKEQGNYDYVVVNDSAERAALEIASIMDSSSQAE